MITLENNRIDYSKSKLSIFISYLMPHKKAFALDMGLSLAVALVDLVFPYVTRRTMNTLLPEQRYAAFFTVMGIVLASYRPSNGDVGGGRHAQGCVHPYSDAVFLLF